MRRGAFAAIALLGAAALPGAALACGICVEDKVAATYDHAVITRATARHHVVVFAAVEGPAEARAQAGAVRQAAARVRGVDAGSVRTASAPQALSFALDPRAASPESALAAIARDPAARGARLTLIKVMR